MYSFFTSFSDKRSKKCVLESATRRALYYCSTEKLLGEELSYIEDVAVANGWERNEAKSNISKVEHKVYQEDFQKLRNPQDFQNKKQAGKTELISQLRMVLPYPGPNMAGKIKRVAKKFDILPVFKSSNTIRSNLVRLKDRIEDSDKRGVVYEIPLQCGKTYLGETCRLFGQRKNEHNDCIMQKQVMKSAIFEHLSECHWTCGEARPRVLWSKTKVLAQEKNKGQRLARESLEIKLRTGHHINRNSGSPEIDDEWLRVVNSLNQGARRERGRPGQSRRRQKRRGDVTMNRVNGPGPLNDHTSVKAIFGSFA